jgi:hypothetical protein
MSILEYLFSKFPELFLTTSGVENLDTHTTTNLIESIFSKNGAELSGEVASGGSPAEVPSLGTPEGAPVQESPVEGSEQVPVEGSEQVPEEGSSVDGGESNSVVSDDSESKSDIMRTNEGLKTEIKSLTIEVEELKKKIEGLQDDIDREKALGEANKRVLDHIARVEGEDMVAADYSDICTPKGNEDYSMNVSDKLAKVIKDGYSTLGEANFKGGSPQDLTTGEANLNPENPQGNSEENLYDADSPQDLNRSTGEASSNVNKRSLDSDTEGHDNKRRKF